MKGRSAINFGVQLFEGGIVTKYLERNQLGSCEQQDKSHLKPSQWFDCLKLKEFFHCAQQRHHRMSTQSTQKFTRHLFYYHDGGCSGAEMAGGENKVSSCLIDQIIFLTWASIRKINKALFLLKNSWDPLQGEEMLKIFKDVRHGAEREQHSALFTLLWHERAARWSYFTQIDGCRISNKTRKPPMNSQLKPYRSTHHSQQHLSSSPSYRKYNTIFYKRTKRTEQLLSYKEQRTGKVCTANVVPPGQGVMNIWNKRVSSLKPKHFGWLFKSGGQFCSKQQPSMNALWCVLLLLCHSSYTNMFTSASLSIHLLIIFLK